MTLKAFLRGSVVAMMFGLCSLGVATAQDTVRDQRGAGVVAPPPRPASPGAVRDHRTPAPEAERPPAGGDMTVVFATISIRCGSGGNATTYTVSVEGGNCEASPRPAGNRQEALCTNSNGSIAGASCEQGCHATQGSGSCTIASRQ